MARRLIDLLDNVKWHCRGGLESIRVSGITTDSREAGPGMLFVALPGLTVDGHKYAREAAARGCVALLVQDGGAPDMAGDGSLTVLETADTRTALGEIAAAFYDHPARQMVITGITGTNGKTTTTYLLEAIIKAAGGNPGIIGTINYRFNGMDFPAPFTTPEPVSLHRLLREMADGGVTHVVMEASSHALAQRRLTGLEFDIALFTNLTRDHLDFHGSMEAYFQAKKELFKQVKRQGQGAAVIITGHKPGPGHEDDWGVRLLNELAAEEARHCPTGNDLQIISCGFEPQRDVAVSRAAYEVEGTTAYMDVMGKPAIIKSKLVGEFNLKNIIGAVGVAAALDLDLASVNRGVEGVSRVAGRLEKIVTDAPAEGKTSAGISVFIDYAHTPDALENALKTLRSLCRGRLFVVFGCGGDRDRGKRFLMGEAAGQLADVVVITADNSRSESTSAIITEIERGVKSAGQQACSTYEAGCRPAGFVAIPDRAQAIARAISWAQPEDIVLVSGKGHEDYQITRDGKVFFDDRLEASRHLAALQAVAN